MPWKDGYTTSDEKSLADHEGQWPEGTQCACVIVVDLSVASVPEELTPADLATAASQCGTQVGLSSLLATLQRFGMTATLRQRSGAIVCISSGAREGTPWTAYSQGGAAYSAAQAGVHGFIRDVALEPAEYGITVNAIAPGPIETERVRATWHHLNETVDSSPNRMTPLRRLGPPMEVAQVVLFLASDEASDITGHTLAGTGGR